MSPSPNITIGWHTIRPPRTGTNQISPSSSTAVLSFPSALVPTTSALNCSPPRIDAFDVLLLPFPSTLRFPKLGRPLSLCTRMLELPAKYVWRFTPRHPTHSHKHGMVPARKPHPAPLAGGVWSCEKRVECRHLSTGRSLSDRQRHPQRHQPGGMRGVLRPGPRQGGHGPGRLGEERRCSSPG